MGGKPPKLIKIKAPFRTGSKYFKFSRWESFVGIAVDKVAGEKEVVIELTYKRDKPRYILEVEQSLEEASINGWMKPNGVHDCFYLPESKITLGSKPIEDTN